MNQNPCSNSSFALSDFFTHKDNQTQSSEQGVWAGRNVKNIVTVNYKATRNLRKQCRKRVLQRCMKFSPLYWLTTDNHRAGLVSRSPGGIRSVWWPEYTLNVESINFHYFKQEKVTELASNSHTGLNDFLLVAVHGSKSFPSFSFELWWVYWNV